MRIQTCCLCGSTNIKVFEELISSPPANNLASTEEESLNAEKYPLGLCQCLNCNHVQLSEELDPKDLFATYNYQTSVSLAFQQHFKKLADELLNEVKAPENSGSKRALDIGSNDGFLLDCFKDLGLDTCGVEPAENLITEHMMEKHHMKNRFFNRKTAEELRLDIGQFDIITANNVFAHTRDLREFTESVEYLLNDEGIFVFEVQYLKSLIDNCLFDMIYTSIHLPFNATNKVLQNMVCSI